MAQRRVCQWVEENEAHFHFLAYRKMLYKNGFFDINRYKLFLNVFYKVLYVTVLMVIYNMFPHCFTYFLQEK